MTPDTGTLTHLLDAFRSLAREQRIAGLTDQHFAMGFSQNLKEVRDTTVPQIARSLGLDQKLTYRRIERRMRDIRVELERSGIAWRDVLDLIGRDEALLQFDLGKQNPRPSIAADGTAPANTEGSQ